MFIEHLLCVKRSIPVTMELTVLCNAHTHACTHARTHTQAITTLDHNVLVYNGSCGSRVSCLDLEIVGSDSAPDLIWGPFCSAFARCTPWGSSSPSSGPLHMLCLFSGGLFFLTHGHRLRTQLRNLCPPPTWHKPVLHVHGHLRPSDPEQDSPQLGGRI